MTGSNASKAGATRGEAHRAPDAQEIISRLGELFPRQTPAQSAIALAIYRLLAEKDDATVSEIASASGASQAEVERQLDEWPAVFRSEEGAVIGFWGLTGREMAHRFVVDGKPRFTWCAWDALFIPALIGKAADVESRTAVDGRLVRLSVTPEAASNSDSDGGRVFVTFRLPRQSGWEDDVLTNFCHHVFFLTESEVSAWLANNADGAALTLEDAYEAGKRKNFNQFGLIGPG